MKTAILGLGNPILSDDAVGIKVARRIAEKFPDIHIIEAATAGFRIMDEVVGYDKLILIDSIKTGKSKPGTLHSFSIDDLKKTLLNAPHLDINFSKALEIYKQKGEEVPEEIVIYAIEVEDIETFSEKCTKKVEKAIPEIVEEIIEEQFKEI
ncbi:MAG: hydrogenase maturation protease [Candidatus Cloacimonetes bacterium]|nr:hydrogenase maturation protease [Candidatus Cloacimonadota bacterium]